MSPNPAADALELKSNKENRADHDVFEQKQISKQFQKIEYVLKHTVTNVIIFFFTLYALLGDDVRRAFFSIEADDYFDGFTTTCLIIFSLEIVLSFISMPNYRMTFFFWLDVISTVSLIFDIQWVDKSIYSE
jgi:hypothetical protein